VGALFPLQLVGFGLSLVLLSGAINRRLRHRFPWLEPAYLPAVAWGWCVYLALYLAARALAAPVEPVRASFTALALGVPLAAAGLAVARRRRPTAPPARGPAECLRDRATLVLVAAFVAGMVVVGPYLEFPTDPVGYLYRVQAWEKVRWADYAWEHAGRFAPFAEHWLLRPSGIDAGDRAGLAWLSALMQGVLLWQVIRLGTLLTGEAVWGWLAGLLSLGYLGYDALSFYRYVVLAGPLLSYIAFLEGLILVVGAFVRGDWRYGLLLPPILLLSWTSHEQGTLFLLDAVTGLAVLLLVFRYRSLAPAFRRILLGWTAAGLVAIVALLALRAPLDPVTEAPDFYTGILGSVLGRPVRYHAALMLHHMIGAVGWVTAAAGLAVLLFARPNRALDVAAALSVWPLLVLWNPLAYEALARVMSLQTFHRLVYGSPYWVLPAVLLGHWAGRLGARQAARAAAGAGLLLLVALSWWAGPPVYGRMRHVWLRVDPRLDGSNLGPLVRYVRAHAERECRDPHPDPRYRPIRRYVLSDGYVNSYLQATGYFYAASSRRGDDLGYESPALGVTVGLEPAMDYARFRAVLRDRAVCYVILYQQDAPLWSWLGATTGHWPPDFARTARLYAPRLVEWVTGHPDDFALVFHDGPIRVYRPRG
jgi:hypothetical protein